MSLRRLSPGLLAAGWLLASHAYAAEGDGPYIGASVGQDRLKLDDTEFNEGDMAFKGFVGYAFGDYLAVEAAYFDGGKPTLDLGSVGSVEAKISGVNASVLLSARKGGAFSFFLKLGWARYDVEATGQVNGVPVATGSEADQDLSYGAGVSYLFAKRYMLRVEYEGVNVTDADFYIATVGIGYKF